MGGEIYSGWLTHWGDEWAGSGLDVFRAQYEFLMRSNYSFSVYVAHGGSNFGLTAGADPRKASSGDYRPHITSYDYDAPINEQGSTTEKYTIFRELAKKYATWDIPDIPLPIPRITIAPFMLRKQGNLFGNLPQPTVANSKVPYLFESNELQMFGQGIVVY